MRRKRNKSVVFGNVPALAGVEAASVLAESSNSTIVKIDSSISGLLPLPVQRLIQAATQVRHLLHVEAVDKKSAIFDALINTAPEASRLCIVNIAVQWRAANLLRRTYDFVIHGMRLLCLTLLLVAMRLRRSEKQISSSRIVLDVMSTYITRNKKTKSRESLLQLPSFQTPLWYREQRSNRSV